MKPTALLIGIALMSPLAWSQQPSIPKTGEASFDFQGARTSYTHVDGSIRESRFGDGATYSANLRFTPHGKPGGDRLSMYLIVRGPGPVDMQSKAGNGVGVQREGVGMYQHYKAKSQCTIHVFKITRNFVEGVADCPVLHKMNEWGEGPQTVSVQQIKFYASAE